MFFIAHWSKEETKMIAQIDKKQPATCHGWKESYALW